MAVPWAATFYSHLFENEHPPSQPFQNPLEVNFAPLRSVGRNKGQRGRSGGLVRTRRHAWTRVRSRRTWSLQRHWKTASLASPLASASSASRRARGEVRYGRLSNTSLRSRPRILASDLLGKHERETPPSPFWDWCFLAGVSICTEYARTRKIADRALDDFFVSLQCYVGQNSFFKPRDGHQRSSGARSPQHPAQRLFQKKHDERDDTDSSVEQIDTARERSPRSLHLEDRQTRGTDFQDAQDAVSHRVRSASQDALRLRIQSGRSATSLLSRDLRQGDRHDAHDSQTFTSKRITTVCVDSLSFDPLLHQQLSAREMPLL